MPCRVLIVSALLPEARAIARAFHLRGRFSRRLEIAPDDAVGVGLVGIKALHLSTLAREVSPQALIMAGVAGGLDPALQVGDVVLQAGDGRSTALELPQHPSLRPLKRGSIHTASTLVATPAEKAALFAATGALAVDMETQSAAQVATDLGIPFLAIRGISDAAGDALDPAIVGLVDPDGRPRISAALGLLARRPAMLGKLLALKRGTGLAMLHVVAVLHAVVASGWPET